MAQQTMTEKDMFLNGFELEYGISLKTLKNFPADKLDWQPAPHMSPAKKIAWMLVLNQMVVPMALTLPELAPGGGLPQPPATLPEMIAAFEKAHAESVAKIRATDESQWNATIKMPVAPKQMGDVRRGDAAWMFFKDTIHHRGQLSVYVRLAGAKLASIYGPTADEPWN